MLEWRCQSFVRKKKGCCLGQVDGSKCPRADDSDALIVAAIGPSRKRLDLSATMNLSVR